MLFTKEQLTEFELKFGKDEDVKYHIKETGYNKMDDENKSFLWKCLAPIIKDKFNYTIPGTEEKLKSEKEILLEQEEKIIFDKEQEKKFEYKLQKLKSMNIKRIYAIDEEKGEEYKCNVKFPLIVNKKRCVFPIHSGELKFVKYYPTFANHKAIQFENNIVGLVTSGMDDCIGVMFYVGKLKDDICYWGGSLAHLPGGSTVGLNWKKMVFNIKPNKLREYLQIEPLYAQALICVQKKVFIQGDTVFDLINKCIIPLGFGYQQIVVYIGDISGGFGILKYGGFGTIYSERLESLFPFK